MEEILSKVILPGKEEYKCFDLLKDLFKKSEDFRKFVIDGINNNSITGFSEELWDIISRLEIDGYHSTHNFEEEFKVGYNIGNCSNTSYNLSYGFDFVHICGGVLPFLENTKNSKDGSHTWVSYAGKYIDTTLMLIIDTQYATEMGYIEQGRINPNRSDIYCLQKERARKNFNNRSK